MDGVSRFIDERSDPEWPCESSNRLFVDLGGREHELGQVAQAPGFAFEPTDPIELQGIVDFTPIALQRNGPDPKGGRALEHVVRDESGQIFRGAAALPGRMGHPAPITLDDRPFFQRLRSGEALQPCPPEALREVRTFRDRQLSPPQGNDMVTKW